MFRFVIVEVEIREDRFLNLFKKMREKFLKNRPKDLEDVKLFNGPHGSHHFCPI